MSFFQAYLADLLRQIENFMLFFTVFLSILEVLRCNRQKVVFFQSGVLY